MAASMASTRRRSSSKDVLSGRGGFMGHIFIAKLSYNEIVNRGSCLLLAALLLGWSGAAPAWAKKAKAAAPADMGTADADTMKLVETFLSRPTAELPPEAVPPFLAVDPATLPARLREKYRAKRYELLALKKTLEGRQKPPLRRLGKEEKAACDIKRESPQFLALMKQTGFAPITEDEEAFVMEKTKCSECELQEEFSLQIVDVLSAKKGQPATRYLLLIDNDPLWALVGLYRQGRTNTTGTSFFGIGMQPACR